MSQSNSANIIDHVFGPIRGIFTFTLIALNTILFGAPLILSIPGKLIPISSISRATSRFIVWLATTWAAGNNLILTATGTMKLQTHGLQGLSTEDWYLVVSNHQSWVDIFVLHCTLSPRISSIKFFLKQQLIWLPIIGIACWGLDFPFMKRYSPAQIKKNPSLRGKDLETTLKSCQKFKEEPASLLNFLEGTRFTAAKHKQQKSQYRHLLKPKIGGFAFTLTALGDRIAHMVDATIVYPHGAPSFWDFMCGRCPAITMHLSQVEIPDQLRHGDYHEDEGYRKFCRQWIHELWQRKDDFLNEQLDHTATGTVANNPSPASEQVRA